MRPSHAGVPPLGIATGYEGLFRAKGAKSSGIEERPCEIGHTASTRRLWRG